MIISFNRVNLLFFILGTKCVFARLELFFLVYFHEFQFIKFYVKMFGYDNLLTYLLTPWCRILLEQLVKKFPAFHGTRRFITALTSVRHLFLSWASPIQPIYQHPTSWRSILILYTHLRLGLPSGFFPSGSPTKTLYTPLPTKVTSIQPTLMGPMDSDNLYVLVYYIHVMDPSEHVPYFYLTTEVHTASKMSCF